ncbi:MAG TPA: DUF2784 domain-containing protein [Planctomycetota bacterium]|nr:DUF2784 domain-containing protein [Planctomycetota bacterium]
MIYALLADLLATFHLGIVLFVLLGQAAILTGILRGWRWIERALFRWTHVGLMVFIAAQGALGAICPLTIWEYDLRVAAGEEGHKGTFVGRLMHDLLFIEPETVSQAELNHYYVAFAALVVFCLWVVPPRRRRLQT